MDYYYAILGVLGFPVTYTILGVIIGSILGFLLQLLNETRRELRQDNAIKAALKIDIVKNVKILNEIDNDVAKFKSKLVFKKDLDFLTAGHIGNMKIEDWKVNLWEKQDIFLFMALSEKNIIDIENFFVKLKKLSSIKTQMKILYSCIKSVEDEDGNPHIDEIYNEMDELLHLLKTFGKIHYDAKVIGKYILGEIL